MKTLQEILEAHKKGEKIDFDKIDYAAIGVSKEKLQEMLKFVEVSKDELDPAKIDWKKITIPEAIIKEKAAGLIEEKIKVEKQKIYDTLEKYKNDVSKLTEDLEGRKKQEEAIKAKQLEEEEKLKREKMSAKEAVSVLEAQYKELLQKKDDELRGQVAAVQKDAEALRLSLHREKLLAKAGETIIPDLLVGNSIAELDQNFEKATAIYKAITEKEQAKMKEALEKAKLEQDQKNATNGAGVKFINQSTIIDRNQTGGGAGTAVLDDQVLRSANKTKLEEIKNLVLKKHGF